MNWREPQMKRNKKWCRNLLIGIIACYAIFTIINQQRTLNQYTQNSQELASQIQEQKEIKEELAKKKDDVNSKEFIEDSAREKLDMYLPNEKVYLDKGM
jgi:cell division protein FtsL